MRDAPQWQKDFNEFSSKMLSVGIRCVHEPYGAGHADSPDFPRRVILTNAARKRNGQASLNEFCNGLVLEMSTWKPLSIPPRQYITSIDTDMTNAALIHDLYDVFAIEDGTTVTFYYWNGVWRISTSNGIDVANVKWNMKTYSEVISETVSMPFEEFCARLDPASCYTIGFRHPDFHPFEIEGRAMHAWSIQSTNLESGIVSYEAFGGLKTQTCLEGVNNVRALYKKLPRALKDYLGGRSINFGYFLRPKYCSEVKQNSNNPLKNLPHIMLESSLLKEIRDRHYSRHITKEAAIMKYDRVKYLILKAYTSPNAYTFISLFPCYASSFEQLNRVVKGVAHAVVNENADGMYDEIVRKIRDNMQNLLSRKESITSTSVRSYLRDPLYIDALYRGWKIASDAIEQCIDNKQ
jgi:hypothetical protein